MRQTTAEGENRNGDIYVINSDGTGLRRLTEGGDYHDPDWSPSGDTIIFDGFGSGIQTVGLNGGDVRLVLDDSLADRPDWSPDGSQVAFHRPGDPGEVFVMNADGSNIRSLGKGFYPDWSPDGSKILFHYRVDGDWDILVINADGTGFANLTAGHTMLKVFAGFIISMGIVGGILPLAFVVALTGLELLIAFLQAYVFTILTCFYINDAIHLH